MPYNQLYDDPDSPTIRSSASGYGSTSSACRVGRFAEFATESECDLEFRKWYELLAALSDKYDK